MKIVFMVAACASVLAVFLICLFLFANGLPAIAKIGPLKFLLGTVWKPSNDKFGIFPMIIASIYVTGGAILIGVPIALFTSVFMARYCPQKIYRPLKSGIELMAGVPSIVYMEETGGALDDSLERLGVVVLEVEVNAKTSSERDISITMLT